MKHKSGTVSLLVLLVLCLITYMFPSIKMTSSENRTLASFSMVFKPDPDSIVYRDTPSERLDAALSDQFAFREMVVNGYMSLFNNLESFMRTIFSPLNKKDDLQYTLHPIGNYSLIEDSKYITICPSTEPMNKEIVEKRVEQLELIHKKYPNMRFYTYYVSQAYDTTWFNSYIGASAADHYQEIVDAVPDYVKTGHLIYDNLNDYMNVHYKTDHHWNHRGSRRGYENIYSLMNKDFKLGDMLIPTRENNISASYDFGFLGSYGKSLGDLYNGGYDSFSFYEYSYPEKDMFILDTEQLKEIQVSELGVYDEYNNGSVDKTIGVNHYSELYGKARDETGNYYYDEWCPFIIKNKNGNGKNLLLCGDSYSRAIRDQLASHFDTTFYFDYRICSKIPIDYIIEQYDINVLLISSQTNMWEGEKFLFTFME